MSKENDILENFIKELSYYSEVKNLSNDLKCGCTGNVGENCNIF